MDDNPDTLPTNLAVDPPSPTNLVATTCYRVERRSTSNYDNPAGAVLFYDLDPTTGLADMRIGHTEAAGRFPSTVRLGTGSIVKVTVEVLADEPAPLKAPPSWKREIGRRAVDHVLGAWFGDEGWHRPNRWPWFTMVDMLDLQAEAWAWLDQQLHLVTVTEDQRGELRSLIVLAIKSASEHGIENYRQHPRRYERPPMARGYHRGDPFGTPTSYLATSEDETSAPIDANPPAL